MRRLSGEKVSGIKPGERSLILESHRVEEENRCLQLPTSAEERQANRGWRKSWPLLTVSCAGPPPAQSAPLSTAASACASSRVFISCPLQAWPAVEPSDYRLPSLRKDRREQLPAVASLRYWFFQNLVTHTFSDFLAPNGWFVLDMLWLIQEACHTPLHRNGKDSCLATCSMKGRCMVWPCTVSGQD